MAIQDKYTNAQLTVGDKANGSLLGGSELSTFVQTFEVAAADDDGSVYRVAVVNSNDFPVSGTVMCDAITAGTDYGLGLYTKGVGGAVVSKDLFMINQTLATASRVLDGTANVDIANLGTKRIWELLGLTADPQIQYDLAFTGDTVGTAAGTVTLVWKYLKEV